MATFGWELARKIRHKWVTRHKIIATFTFLCGTCLVHDMTTEKRLFKGYFFYFWLHSCRAIIMRDIYSQKEGSVIMRQIESVKKKDGNFFSAILFIRDENEIM